MTDSLDEVFAVFCGAIDQQAAQRIIFNLTGAINGGVKHVHLLFQSAGGYVGDGVFLYEFFRAMPIELTLYNAGQISSAGFVAYLGAKNRKTTRHASFMLHRTGNAPAFSNASKLESVAKSLRADDARTEAIIKTHVKLPQEQWADFEHHDIYLSGEEAVASGVAHGITDFAPPFGVRLFNMLA